MVPTPIVKSWGCVSVDGKDGEHPEQGIYIKMKGNSPPPTAHRRGVVEVRLIVKKPDMEQKGGSPMIANRTCRRIWLCSAATLLTTAALLAQAPSGGGQQPSMPSQQPQTNSSMGVP